MPLDQAFTQAPAGARPSLQSSHLSRVVLVIIAKEVEEPVQSQDAHFRPERMPRRPRLPPGHAGGDDDIAQVSAFLGRPAPPPPIGGGGKRKDIGGAILAAISPVEQTDA